MKSNPPLFPTPLVNITSASLSGHQSVVYNFYPFSEHIELIPSPITFFPIVAFLYIWFLSCCCHPACEFCQIHIPVHGFNQIPLQLLLYSFQMPSFGSQGLSPSDLILLHILPPQFMNPIFHFSLFPNRATRFSQANLLIPTPISNLLLCTSYSFACTVFYLHKAFILSALRNCTSTFLTSSFKI